MKEIISFDNYNIEQANSGDSKELLDLQKLAFRKEAEIYNDFAS